MASTQMEGADAQAIRVNKLSLVERLADDLAHEIKNPLHSMVINLEVLRRRISRVQEAEQADLLRYAGVLSGELDRVTRRVETLLRLVRPERGVEMVTLAQTVEEMMELIELERERRGVSIDFRPGLIPVRADLHREHAWQLTLNLILEALDAAVPGGTLRIRTDTQEGRNLLIIEVESVNTSAGPLAASPESGRLPVLRTLAQTLGGDLEITGDDAISAAGRPAEFVLSLPIAPR